MPKLPSLSYKEVVSLLTSVGYKMMRQKGSHVRFSHEYKSSITVPKHPKIAKGLLRKILRDAEIRIEEVQK